ncbi:hypothetical protein E0Z10_g1030 [Xylaria hypoxylon]|uniref:SnoaL-like domain-containing protein n=1 Tax=Xylaria hypoxylon TaxID=37992 RepID=A0A4Z0YUG5_9PEZI|nr:hypothetical protein E0Z10_g1030 [Xylaria hypoxylon]
MGMMDYVVTYPAGIVVDERVKKFISSFYEVSDDPSRNGEWVNYFTPDASLVMGDKKARGIRDIRTLRESMWEKIKSRRHKLDKVFPAAFALPEHESERQFEYMIYGSVDLELKGGEKMAGQWAGRAVLRDDEGRLKYAFYQVYIHTYVGTATP